MTDEILMADVAAAWKKPTPAFRYARRKVKSERHIEGMFRPVEVTTETLVLQQQWLVDYGTHGGMEWRDVPVEDE